MTTPGPTNPGGGSDDSKSVHWTSIKLNVIMLPVSIGILILLIAVLCLCRFLRERRNKELEKQRQKELRVAKRKYNEKLKDALRSQEVVGAHSNGKSRNGKPFSPRPKREKKRDNSSSSTSEMIRDDSEALDIEKGKMDCTVRKVSQSSFGSPLKREGTFTVEIEKNNSDNQEDEVACNDKIKDRNVRQPERKNTFTLEYDNAHESTTDAEQNLSENDEKLESISSRNSIFSNPPGQVKVILRNGTVGVREDLPHPNLHSPTKNASSFDKPPPTYLTTKLLKHDRKVIPPITHVAITK